MGPNGPSIELWYWNGLMASGLNYDIGVLQSNAPQYWIMILVHFHGAGIELWYVLLSANSSLRVILNVNHGPQTPDQRLGLQAQPVRHVEPFRPATLGPLLLLLLVCQPTPWTGSLFADQWGAIRLTLCFCGSLFMSMHQIVNPYPRSPSIGHGTNPYLSLDLRGDDVLDLISVWIL